MLQSLRHWFNRDEIRELLTWRTIRAAFKQPVFITTMLILVGAWSFAELADAIDEEGTIRFDEYVLRSLRVTDNPERMVGPRWVEQSVRDMTAMGGVTVLTMLTLVICGYLWIDGKHKFALFAFVAVASGTAVTFALKGVFDRPRPELVPHILVTVYSDSFPSGHAMASAIVYLTLGAMLTEATKNWWLKAYIMTVAIVLTLMIGTTRVCLGVHYPTDVLAGWAGGFIWAYGCRTVVRLARLVGRFREIRATSTVDLVE